jgi:hypothetical protein
MLDGTDLYAAFQPLGGNNNQDSYTTLYNKNADESPNQKDEPPESAPPPPQQPNMYEAKQFDTEQRLNNILNEIKKKKNEQQDNNQPSYLDKLFGKKKEILKILQLSLIITLGLSLHFLIDHYLTNYLQENDLSFERKLILRLLYPVALLFILWNLKVFIK